MSRFPRVGLKMAEVYPGAGVRHLTDERFAETPSFDIESPSLLANRVSIQPWQFSGNRVLLSVDRSPHRPAPDTERNYP